MSRFSRDGKGANLSAILTVTSGGHVSLRNLVIRVIDDNGDAQIVGDDSHHRQGEEDPGSRFRCFMGDLAGKKFTVVLEYIGSTPHFSYSAAKLQLQVKDLRSGVASRGCDDHLATSTSCVGSGHLWRVGELCFERRRRGRWVAQLNRTFNSPWDCFAYLLRLQQTNLTSTGDSTNTYYATGTDHTPPLPPRTDSTEPAHTHPTLPLLPTPTTRPTKRARPAPPPLLIPAPIRSATFLAQYTPRIVPPSQLGQAEFINF